MVSLGKAIEIGAVDLLHFDAEAVLQPLGGEMAVAPFGADVAVARRFPAKHYWYLTVAEELVVDCTRVEAFEDLPISCQILLWRSRLEPRAGFECAQPVVTGL